MQKLIRHILLIIFALTFSFTQAETYSFYDIISIDVDSNIYELRKDSDEYTKHLPTASSSNGYYSIVFQQKGLGQIDTTALKQYSRILIAVTDMPHGTYQCCNDEPDITPEIRTQLLSECDHQSKPFEYLPYCEPTIDIFQTSKGYYVTRVRYTRTGLEGDVMCTLYRLQNSKNSAIILTSYRVSDAKNFRDCINNAIDSFQWKTDYRKPTNNNIIYTSIAALMGMIGIAALIFLIYKYKQNYAD